MTDPGPLPRRGGILTLVAVGAVGLVVGAWWFLGGGVAEPPDPTAPARVEVGTAAPSFTVRLLDGGTFSLASHQNEDGRPVLLNFWASWCIPCRAEMPALDAAARANPGVLVLGIATDDTEAAASRFAEEVGVAYPLGIDTTGVVSADFGTFGLPTTYAIDAAGTVTAISFGELDEAEIAEMLATFD